MADPITAEQVLATCTEIAKTNGDSFRARVGMRQSGGSFVSTVATFDDVTVAHLAAPEMWLGRMLGGGQYQIQVSHPNSGVALVGVILVNIQGQSKPIDVAAMDAPDWAGPRSLIFPQRAAAPSAATGFTIPPGSPPAQRLAPPSQSNVGDPGGAVHPSIRQDPAFIAEMDRLRERERMLEANAAAERARLSEERHRMEREADKREQEARLAAMEARLSAASKPSGQSDLAAVLTAIAAQQQQASSQMMQMFMEMNKATREEAARQAAAQSQAIAESQKTTAVLMEKMLSKPAVDPLMERMLDDARTSSAHQAETFAKLGEATTGIINMALGAVHSMQELTSGPGEPPMLTVAKEVVKGVVAYAEATKATAAAPKVTVPPVRRNGATRRAAPAKAPVAAPPAPAVPQEGQPVAFDGVEEGEESGEETMSAFDQIVRAITEKRDLAEVADFFVSNLDEPSINEALAAANGNPLVAFQGALGAWVQADPDNYAYVVELLKQVEEIGVKKGVVHKATPEEREQAEKAIAQMVSTQPQA